MKKESVSLKLDLKGLIIILIFALILLKADYSSFVSVLLKLINH